ncbi:MAG: ATP-dependent sacrificial sulfur transferase LarE [Oscillospiraceae bacterium]|nr:ATP-dependent sacrificial sulfur transferase LarE [Oscillospiraceae bacterium]
MDELHEKKQRLEAILNELGSVAVAFSSGVDSTFLLKIAHDILGEKAVAVTARSCFFTVREFNEAKAFCENEGIEQIVAETDELSIDGFNQNPPNRCYLCKRELFKKFRQIAEERGIPYVVEGSNVDDTGDYRPGLIAVAELDIKSPLREAGFTKDDIRRLSKDMGLPTWDKPSFACLASRFVYGETITREKLSMIERAEQKLLDLGFRQVRVRIQGNIARIEIDT